MADVTSTNLLSWLSVSTPSWGVLPLGGDGVGQGDMQTLLGLYSGVAVGGGGGVLPAVSSNDLLSLLNLGMPWWSTLPLATGGTVQADSQHFLGLYSGILVGALSPGGGEIGRASCRERV